MKLRSLFAALIAVFLAVGVMTMSASAAETVTVKAVQESVSSVGRAAYSKSVKEAASVLRSGMKQRQAEITVNYQVDETKFSGTEAAVQDLVNQIYEQALAHTGVPDEGDYLRWHFKGFECSCSYSLSGGVYYFTLLFDCEYCSTLAQENAVTAKVADLIDQLSLNKNITDYQKIANIYNYICSSDIEYDFVHVNDESYKRQYTAYAALMDRTAVCQGFSSLFYRLALEAGIDARVISGQSTSQNGTLVSHAWNIVKLNGKYYNLDATWDIGVWNYSYFLCGKQGFGDHIEDSEYASGTFTSAYPLSASSYTHAADFSAAAGDYAYTVRYGRAAITRYNGKDTVVNVPSALGGYPVFSIDERAFDTCLTLQEITIPETVVSIGNYAFQYCEALETVRFAGSAPKIGPSTFFEVHATAFYPAGDASWSGSVRQNYTGQITWQAYGDPGKNGWVSENGKWYYYENGVVLTNRWCKDSIGWVYLGSDGAMLTNAWCKDSKGWCYVGADGYAVTNCWKNDSVGRIYLDSNGSMTKNKWILDGGKWYYLDANGYMARNCWSRDSVGWVYVGSDGAMLTNAWCKDSAGWCYVGADGYAVTNCWKKDSTGWIYLDSNGSMTKNKWVQDGGKWYYLDANGYMATNAWKKDSVGWVYVGSNGAMLTNAWCKDSKGWCYVGADGYAVTNCWKKDSVGWIYLDENGSMTKNKWVQDGGKWYYLDANGYMV